MSVFLVIESRKQQKFLFICWRNSSITSPFTWWCGLRVSQLKYWSASEDTDHFMVTGAQVPDRGHCYVQVRRDHGFRRHERQLSCLAEGNEESQEVSYGVSNNIWSIQHIFFPQWDWGNHTANVFIDHNAACLSLCWMSFADRCLWERSTERWAQTFFLFFLKK